MLQMIDHLKLHFLFEASQLSRENNYMYSYEILERCLAKIQQYGLMSHTYKACIRVQQELIENDMFAEYFSLLMEEGVSSQTVDDALHISDTYGYKLTDYPVEKMKAVLQLKLLSPTEKHIVLKYFSDRELTQEIMRVLEDNLSMLTESEIAQFQQLEAALKDVFLEPLLSHDNMIPKGCLIPAVRALAADGNLKALLQFLYKEDITVEFSSKAFEMITAHSEPIYNGLKEIYGLLETNGKTMNMFMERWTENGCLQTELKSVLAKIKSLTKEQRKTIFDTRCSYVNLIYRRQIGGLPLETATAWQEDILIYAISHGKKRFIKVIEETGELFWKMSRYSLLFNPLFYQVYINLNTLSPKNLMECGNLHYSIWNLEQLDPGIYTFEEIKELYGLPKEYLDLYSRLTCPKVDQRLLIMREISKGKLLYTQSTSKLYSLAQYLSIKPLSKWRDQEFGHIKINLAEALILLLNYQEVAKFLPHVSGKNEAIFLSRNAEKIQDYKSLEDIRNNLGEIDSEWISLIKEMNFSEEFLQQYSDTIRLFLYQGGPHMALTYYRQLEELQQEAFKRIVKAELMGQLSKVKYNEGDLQREIGFPVARSLENSWKFNGEWKKAEVTIRECDDFYSTIQMGVMPHRTCMSYIDGQYNECLLSNFDSNKKILYVWLGGTIVGRAILRLTKGRFSLPQSNSKGNGTSLSFADLEEITERNLEEEPQEHLVLFLEMAYTAHINNEMANNVKSMLVAAAEAKALNLGVMLVVSSNYSAAITESYIKTAMHIYISKSKAGHQYLDSLSGQAKVSDEGTYRCDHFFIKHGIE